MNTANVLKYGHLTVLGAIEGLPDSQWETLGVCGVWSVKDIIAHLASYEHVLVDVLRTFLDGGPTPALEKFLDQSEDFNDSQVAMRQGKSPAEIRAEYNDIQAEVTALVVQIPADTLRTVGTLPWYGAEYDLEDFIVYTFYGHKREHCAQIAVYRDSLSS